jgi:Ankyrin repeats (many copies)
VCAQLSLYLLQCNGFTVALLDALNLACCFAFRLSQVVAAAQVVELLLQHCSKHGIRWTDVRRYGDGWTPLMSAIVADHLPVAQRLLDAAGSRAAELIEARNKYGSTAVHLAAYRGSVPLITLLLKHRVRSAAGWKDSQGLTPVQIARKHSHKPAEALLARQIVAVKA